MIFGLGVTLLFDFKLLNTKPFNSLELECAVKLSIAFGKKNGLSKKRTLVVVILR